MSKALDDVAAERSRQVEAEGWTPEHDDTHDKGEMALAAHAYVGHAYGVARFDNCGLPETWPDWGLQSFKPKDARRDLVRAAALIVAEIERLDRVANR